MDNTNGNIYIGSTCEPTSARRLQCHRTNYRRYVKNLQPHNTRSSEILKNGDYNIVLIELYPCNSKDELQARERYYIESMDCVNKVIPGRTDKEYYLHHREKEIKRAFEHRNSNRQIITCFCGSQFYKYIKSYHVRCMKHKQYVHNLKQILRNGDEKLKEQMN